MGNRNTQEEDNFRALTHDQRAATFDERRHLSTALPNRLPSAPHSPQSEENLDVDRSFRPLQRAATYDPRLRTQKSTLTTSDVMYRRFFNLHEQRVPVKNLPISDPHEHLKPAREAVIVVDPFSTGETLAEKVLAHGYACICLCSDTLTVMEALVLRMPRSLKDQLSGILYHPPPSDSDSDSPQNALLSIIAKLKETQNLHIVGILPGCETGVLLADALSEKLSLRTNGTKSSIARRNKYIMGERVRQAGLKAPKQRSVTKWSEIQDFLQTQMRSAEAKEFPKVIVKPIQSSGSDDVLLCDSLEKVQRAFGSIQGKINSLGALNNATLVQEYVTGTEYVVDTVSRDGEHKAVAIWEYDKREANGAPFVYFGLWLYANLNDSVVDKMVQYVFRVLDALEIRNGPAHAEIKIQNGEPYLIEIGARCHGSKGSFLSIVDRCIGYNQVDVTLNAYFDKTAFDNIPDRPNKLKAFGCETMLVSYKAGVLESCPGMEEIRKMPSFLSEALHCPQTMKRTVDLYTTPGSVLLVHDDITTLRKDYERIRELENDGLFLLSPVQAEKVIDQQKKIVVVVDPFSTGAVVAHQLMQKGCECICVYSNRLECIEHVASLIPEGLTLSFAATIAYEDNLKALVAAIRDAARQIQGDAIQEPVIHAVLPGAELGVLLADAITDALQLKGNRMENTAARRDKYLMGETLRNAQLRAVRQVKAQNWAQAQAFIEELEPVPFEVVLKPLESAGTEDVVLCRSMEEAEVAFNNTFGKINGLGIRNEAVLVQEYLDGNEYVVDTVSLNGVHKITAIWKYDKRRVNDAAFVYFGLSIVPATGSLNDLIEYQFQVLDALGIRNGPAHGEIKFCRNSPVLIEVGARCHGGEGAWIPIANHCVGYNQVDVMIDAFLDPQSFQSLPDRPRTMHRYGCEVMLVSYRNGTLLSTPGLAEIEKLPSFLQKEIFVSVGDRISRTIDMFTTPGSIMLVHESHSVLEQDIQRIRELETQGLFELEEEM